MCVSCADGGKHIAAVWWRVSTDDQREKLSPETQVCAAVAVLESQGYMVPSEYIIGTDGASLELLEAPQFKTLMGWVALKQMHAVGVYNRDRLPGKPGARAYFFAMCKSKSVKLYAPDGGVALDGHIEKVTEYLLSWAKEEQVLRAQQASKDGLRDRTRIKGVPTCGKAPFGYSWTHDRKRLTPNERYEDAKRIWDMALEGMPMRSIAFALVRSGIPSSKGKPTWHVSIIHNILNNPVYCGEIMPSAWK